MWGDCVAAILKAQNAWKFTCIFVLACYLMYELKDFAVPMSTVGLGASEEHVDKLVAKSATTLRANESFIRREHDKEEVKVDISNHATQRNVLQEIPETSNRSVTNEHQSRDHTGIYQIGQFKHGRRYAVYGSSFFYDNASVNYAFDLPLSALAWHRVGFDSLIMVTGSLEPCRKDSKFQYVFDTLKTMDHVVILVLADVIHKHSVVMSLMSRLFAAFLVQDGGDPATWDNTYLLVADADIWPTSRGFLELPDDKDILHGIIGKTVAQEIHSTHAPTSYVGMKVKTWKDAMTIFGNLRAPITTSGVMEYVESAFGPDCCDNYEHIHGGPGWFLDQKLVNKRITDWKKRQNSLEGVHVYTRDAAKDRLNRSRGHWAADSLEGKLDAHIFRYSYRRDVWARLLPVLELLHPPHTVDWCNEYFEHFNVLADVC